MGDRALLAKILQAGFWVTLGIVLGRAAGLVRESTVAASFGLSGDADVVVLMLTVPDLLVNILVGGGLAAALIPEFKRIGREEAQGLFVQFSLLVAAVFALLTVLLVWQAPNVVRGFAPGLTGETARLAAGGLAGVLWLIPLTTLAGVSTAYLHAGNRFGVAAQGTLIFNLTVIAGLLAVAGRTNFLSVLAWFVVGGGLLRWGSQLLRILIRGDFPRSGWRAWLGRRQVAPGLIGRYLNATAAAGVLLLLPVTARAMATLWEEGSLASINYALKMVELPLGAAIAVLTVVLFPRLSELYVRDQDQRAYMKLLREGLLWTWLLSLAAMLPMWWFREEFIRLAFGWGQMTDEGLAKVSRLLGIGLLALPFMGLSSLLTATFNSRQDTRTPLLINLCGWFCAGVGGWLAGREFGLSGVLAGLVAGYVVVTVLQVALLALRHDIHVTKVLFSAQSAKITLVSVGVTLPPGWLLAGNELGALPGVATAAAAALATVVLVIGLTPAYRRAGLDLLRRERP